MPHSRKKTPNTQQVASKGLIASAVTESLSIQHVERDGGQRGATVLDGAVRAAALIISECFSVVSGGGGKQCGGGVSGCQWRPGDRWGGCQVGLMWVERLSLTMERASLDGRRGLLLWTV